MRRAELAAGWEIYSTIINLEVPTRNQRSRRILSANRPSKDIRRLSPPKA